MMSDCKYCAECTYASYDPYRAEDVRMEFTPNCKNCDDLIGETDNGRVYRNNRPGREEVVFSEDKPHRTTARYYDDINSFDIDFEPLEMEKSMAYLQKFTDKEKADRKQQKSKAVGLPQASGPGDIGKAGTELAIPTDVIPTPFVNYVKPIASPNMVVKVPHETETGVIMPPLPKHECEPPNAVITHADKWESKKKHDEVVEPDGSVFSCVCGKDWYVRVQKVPFHISEYDPQYVYNWKPVRWFNLSRQADIRKRKEH